MKYSDVPEGGVFYIEGSVTYPKLKIGMGHKDLRDDCVNLVGNPDWEVELVPPTKVEITYFKASGKYYTTHVLEFEPHVSWHRMIEWLKAYFSDPEKVNPGMSTEIWPGYILVVPQRDDLKVPFMFDFTIP